MSKYCTKCSAELSDDDIFCGNCGAKQETDNQNNKSSVENNPEKDANINAERRNTGTITQPVFSASTVNKSKRNKKPLIWVIAGIALVCILAVLAIGGVTTVGVIAVLGTSMFGRNKGLMALDDVEQKVNEAFLKLEGDELSFFDGVTEFEIRDVDADTHDQTFSCCILPSGYGVEFSVLGLVKEEQVIQMQCVFCDYREDYFIKYDEDRDLRDAMLMMAVFPISIFKEDIDTMQELDEYIDSMDIVYADPSGQICRQTVDDDIEYTYMYFTGGLPMSVFTIRYLPAFSTGYLEENFEEEDD